MPRTCLACASPNRKLIDAALASGEPLREIAEKSRISISALHRHKAHAEQAIVKASQRREISIGESVMSRLERLYLRAEKVLNDAEASGDGRLALAGIREVRETLGGLFTLASKAAELSGNEGGPMSIADRLRRARERLTTSDLKAELSSRGEQLEVVLTHRVIGPQGVFEDRRELPASAVDPAYHEAGWNYYKARECSEKGVDA